VKKEAEKDNGTARMKIGKVEVVEMTGEDMMMVQGGAEVNTGKMEEIEITGGDMMLGQGRMKDVL